MNKDNNTNNELTSLKKLETKIVSGMRPTGALHLGHYFGVLKNWVEMQEKYKCYFFVADWHALTSEYENPKRIKTFVPELVKDWIASGLDPEKSVIYRQSDIKEIAELHLLLSMSTPVSWVERCPTYKEQQQQITGKDLATYGFLGYPVLMTADIIMFRSKLVPVGQDQLPHLELSREICRRFNNFYGEFFLEPEALLTKAAKCPGLDGRKMSKSYGNSIMLSESLSDVEPKIKGMLTDSKRIRRTDVGDPDTCNLFPYHELLSSQQEQTEIRQGCTSAALGCVDCKKILLKNLGAFLEPMQERRAKLNDKVLYEIIEAGNQKARIEAQKTMEQVRKLVGMN
ncbi:tryptophan--tRNA ligase [Desulfovibrio litoralis]|uniref:Tryptophan--tRNA ligase n=1 Tax=Desulfovibrio litoralis DSM 11393 TaxID=1121455 RepID=A0A1M7S0L1_9BACT|nr:tryptophan--tRNA ligase [Desulfovibrio litoralis]SHN52117.1 tryptophanyl-tRNA synthetase [Desulfovibrio litoralis DSM 11393]